MKVLALVDAPDHVCCRYRIRAFEPALSDAGCQLTLRGLVRGVVARWLQLRRVSEYDAVILQRKLLPSWQLAALRKRSRHLVFDFDDAVLYRDSYDARGPHSFRRERRFAQTVRLADSVIAGNDFLADCALRAGASPERVRVIPTCVDTTRYMPRSRHGENPSGLDLVWIGSSSTLQGLEQRRMLWERIGRELPGVRLRLICDRFPEFGPLPVVPIAWNETSEAAALASGDVGVSWIPDDLWSRGKCGLKVVQYQAAGLPVLTNPVGVHVQMVVPGKTGLLAETDDEWMAAIRELLRDPEARQRMGTAARASVEVGYSVAAWAESFVSSVVAPPPAPMVRGEVALHHPKPRERPGLRSHSSIPKPPSDFEAARVSVSDG